MNVVIYDIETLKEYFLVVCLVPNHPYRVQRPPLGGL